MSEQEYRYTPEAVTRQIQLTTELKTTSDLLLPIFPLGEARTWHIVSPTFDKPKVFLHGFDISDRLYDLAQKTRDLHASVGYLPAEFDGDEFEPASYTWEVFPPHGSSFIGRFSSSCTLSADLPGIGLAAYIPDIDKPLNQDELRMHKEYGSLNIDMLIYKAELEGFPYRFQKPESVMMSMVEQDPVASLEVANWFLRGLLTAKDIHPEQVELKDIEF
ncbi:MAG TPA: hypothetical protein VG917_00860 [Patescibacteria group bacterium]|nr:hypothetical protein [Patescibacteria group bacterium]